MLYCVRAKVIRNGCYYTNKFMLCKKRRPSIGYVLSKIGHLNNYFGRFTNKIAILNLTKSRCIFNFGYTPMNRVAYKSLGLIFGNAKTKKGRYY
jgi:hypothetical protein